MRPRPPLSEEQATLAGELLGSPIRLEGTSGAGRVHGVLVDETLSTLLIRRDDDGRIVRIPKQGATGLLFVNGREIPFRGDALRMRPEDRTKRLAWTGRGAPA
jgi:RNase P/RNase MRP subunit p29